MDDKSVKTTVPNPQSPPPPGDEAPPVTLSDLYGPSDSQQTSSQQPYPTQPVTQQPEPAPQMPIQEQQPYTQPIQQSAPEVQPMPVENQPSAGKPPAAAMTATGQTPPPGGTPPAPPPFPPSFPFSLLTHPKAKLFLIGGAVIFLLFIIVMFAFSRKGTTTGGKVTLSYWGLWDDSKTMKPIIADFQRLHPNITVEYKKADNKQYKERLTTRIKNGTGPDIFTYHNSWTPTLKTSLAPLSTDAITPDEFKKTYFPVVQKDLAIDGAIYGLPQGIDTIALFINKEIFDAAGLNIPDNWDDFIKAAKSLTRKEENGKIISSGAALGTFDNITHAPDIATLMMLQNYTELDKFQDETMKKNIVGGLSFYTDFANSTNNIWSNTNNPSIMAFSNSETAMFFGYSWDIFQIKANNPDLKFVVAPVPYSPGRKVAVASYWANGVSAKSTHQPEAMLFMHYLAQKDVVQKLYTEQSKTRLFGTPYANVELAKTLEANPLLAPFVQQAAYAESTFFSSDTQDTEYNERLNKYLNDAINAIGPHQSAESAAETLISGVGQIRSQYGL
jgi:multiple sugar transport system substrate-binding protein